MTKTCIAMFVVLLAGCATPTTRGITVSAEATKEEAGKQMELAVQDMVDEQKRIMRVYRTLSTKANSFCGDYVGPTAGFFALPKPKGDVGQIYEKLYGIREQRTVLFVLEGTPAESAGIKAGDVLKSINDVNTNDVQQLEELSATAPPDAALKYKIERAGAPIELTVKPDRACRYPIQLDQQQVVNAFADGKRILVTRGMVNFVKNDNELALVIAHELAHNTMKHIDAKTQNMAVGVLADLAVVLLSRGQVRNSTFGQIGAGAYSQEFEAEADYVGLYIMANAGMPITDAPKFWRRMAAANPSSIKTSHTASHPSTSYRMVALEETVKEINAKIEKGEPLVPNMKDGKFKAPTK